MRRILCAFSLSFALLALATASLAETAVKLGSGRELVEAAYAQRRPSAMKMSMQMTLSEKGGKQWNRQASLISKQKENGNQMQVFAFVDPPALAGSAVLTRQEPGTESAQWVYIPAYHTARRIPSANIGEAYLGTDYSFEDVLDKRWELYEFKDLGIESVGNSRLTKVEARPRDEALKNTSAYSRTVYWLEPVRKVVVKEEYFGKDGALLKRLSNSALKSYGKYYLWDAAIMESVRTGHRTTIQVLSREVEVPIADDLFTERALKRVK